MQPITTHSFPIPRLHVIPLPSISHSLLFPFPVPTLGQAYLGEVAMVSEGQCKNITIFLSVRFYLHSYVGWLVYKYVRMVVTQYRPEL
jgi:hypothetical protein